MGIGEPASLCRQLIDVGCLYFRRAVAAQVAIAKVIGEDQDDVGLLRRTQWQGQPKDHGTNEVQKFHFSFFRRVLVGCRFGCRLCLSSAMVSTMEGATMPQSFS